MRSSPKLVVAAFAARQSTYAKWQTPAMSQSEEHSRAEAYGTHLAFSPVPRIRRRSWVSQDLSIGGERFIPVPCIPAQPPLAELPLEGHRKKDQQNQDKEDPLCLPRRKPQGSYKEATRKLQGGKTEGSPANRRQARFPPLGGRFGPWAIWAMCLRVACLQVNPVHGKVAATWQQREGATDTSEARMAK